MNLPKNVFFSFFVLLSVSCWADWPTYLADSQRSGVTSEPLSAELSLQWSFVPGAPPKHAWTDPQPKPIEGILELPRLRFDDAFHVTASQGLAYFGSSSENRVVALDAKTGAIRWEFFTEGPVRNAPTIADGKLYFGADDGFAYCLSASSGSLQWRFQAAPSNAHVLGNGRMISLWPIRTGVLVEGGIAYFGAGVFPGEGLYLYALNAASGEVVWCNDNYGDGGRANVTPQGYLLLDEKRIFMASGRVVPAVFQRENGIRVTQRNPSRFSVGTFGGTYAKLDEGFLYNGTEKLFAFRASDEAMQMMIQARKIAFTKDRVFLLTGKTLESYAKQEWKTASRQSLSLQLRLFQNKPLLARANRDKKRFESRKQAVPNRTLEEVRKYQQLVDKDQQKLDALTAKFLQKSHLEASCPATDALVVSGNYVVVGGVDFVQLFSLDDFSKTTTFKISGKARGLSISDGNLYVSSDNGTIYCFGAGRTKGTIVKPTAIAPAAVPGEFSAWKTILEQAPENGYALVLGKRALEATFTLATQTKLNICMGTENPAPARRKIAAAGLYGNRVSAFAVAPDSPLPFSPYFADLIVVTDPVSDKQLAEQIVNVLKPWGGVVLLPRESAQHIRPLQGDAPLAESPLGSSWVQFIRGGLRGAGSWGHEYGEPGNLGSNDEKRIHGDLGVLWFGEPGAGRMPSRHASNAAPLAANGRLFVQGENVIMCFDSSNGAKRWQREIPGAYRTGLKVRCSNIVCSGEFLYVVAKGVCLRLRASDGTTVASLAAPKKPTGEGRSWGDWIAVEGETVYGSSSSNTVFALDAVSGNPLWQVEVPKFSSITLALNSGKIYFIHKSPSETQRAAIMQKVGATQKIDRMGKPIPHDVRVVCALDAKTGNQLWETPQYVSDCVKVGSTGGKLTLMATPEVVLLAGQPWNGHFWKDFFAGHFERRSLIALSAKDGRELWSGNKGYRSRPIIIGDMIVAEPWAHDLKTGVAKKLPNEITGVENKWQFSRPGHHCGNIVGCESMLFFRSWNAACYDLESKMGTVCFGSQRTGCWINFIPANGVVLMPEASSGCICPFPLQCSTTFIPVKKRRSWAQFSAEGKSTPINELNINFGAPGDRRDEKGKLWLSYPRPAKGRLVFDIKAKASYAAGAQKQFRSGQHAPKKAGAEIAWVSRSAALGMTKFSMTLVEEADGVALYTLRLHFSSPQNADPGTANFELAVQDQKPIALDPVLKAGGRGKAFVQEFKGVRCANEIKIALTSAKDKPTSEQLPQLNGLEIIREKVISVGMAPHQPVYLNHALTNQERSIKMANWTGKTFAGTLVVSAPDGLQVTPRSIPITLAHGEQLNPTFEIHHAAAGPATDYPVQYRLLSSVGERLENECATLVKYTANRGRKTINTSADSHVAKDKPDYNYGHYTALLVDGGSAEMGDSSFRTTFLSFPIDVPGKVVSATFRIYVPAGGHTQSGNSGDLCLVTAPWNEKTINFNNQPAIGEKIGFLGKVSQETWEARRLDVDLSNRKQLDIAIVPRSCDGATYDSRETHRPPQLVIEYEIPIPE